MRTVTPNSIQKISPNTVEIEYRYKCSGLECIQLIEQSAPAQAYRSEVFICFMQEVEFMRKKSVFIPVVLLIAAFVSSLGWGADETKIVVMNPRGIKPEIRKIPMAQRPATLDGKMVYIVDTKYPNTKPFVNELFAALKVKYPKTTWVLREKFAGYMDDDPNLWKEIKEKDACAIVLVGH